MTEMTLNFSLKLNIDFDFDAGDEVPERFVEILKAQLQGYITDRIADDYDSNGLADYVSDVSGYAVESIGVTVV